MNARLLVVAALSLAGCVTGPTPREIEAAEQHHDLAVIAVRNNRAQEALRELQESVRLNPRLASAWNAMGLIYQFSYGRTVDAQQSFEKAIAVRPDFTEAHNNLGVLLADQGKLEEARAHFETALADTMYPTPFIAQVNLGWVLHLQGKTAEGEGMVRGALIARPEFCMGHRQLARILEARGVQPDADASWSRFHKFCPDEPEALLKVGGVHLRANQLPKARNAWLKCIEKAGERAIGSDCRAALSSLPPLDDAHVGTDDEEPPQEENRSRVVDPIVETTTTIPAGQ